MFFYSCHVRKLWLVCESMDGAFGEYLNSNHGETESVEKDPIGMGLAFHLTKPRQTQNSTVLKHSIVQDVQGQTMLKLKIFHRKLQNKTQNSILYMERHDNIINIL